jgi:hypothetical protein
VVCPGQRTPIPSVHSMGTGYVASFYHLEEKRSFRTNELETAAHHCLTSLDLRTIPTALSLIFTHHGHDPPS